MGYGYIKRETRTGPTVAIDCPVCGARGVSSQTFEYRDRLYAAYVLPLWTTTARFVSCGACTRHLIVDVREELSELANLKPDQLADRIRPYLSLPGRVCTILGLAFFWAPFIGPVISAIALPLVWRSPGWRRAAIVALTLALIVSCAVIALLLFSGPSPYQARPR